MVKLVEYYHAKIKHKIIHECQTIIATTFWPRKPIAELFELIATEANKRKAK